MSNKKSSRTTYFTGIDEMRKMSKEDYRAFLSREEICLVDSHGALISAIAGYPIAATKEQLDLYIEELKKLKHELDF